MNKRFVILVSVGVAVAAILLILIIVNRPSSAPGGGENDAPTSARITIVDPANGTVVDVGAPFAVRGTGEGLPEGTVVVEALDAAGNVLAMQPTIVTASDAGIGGAGPWSVQLSAQVSPGTPGSIRAYSQSPADGSFMAETSVAVVFGEAPPPIQAEISINIPQQGETVGTQEVVVVGTGTALPENNVYVQVLTADGTVLAEAATTVNAELGGTGEWRATLGYAVEPGTLGRIVASSTSPADGTIIAIASVDVQYGTAPQSEPTITIDTPTSGEAVNPAEIVVSGTGTALPENNVIVRVLDNASNVLAEAPAVVDAELGGTGPWRVTLSVDVGNNSAGQILAFSSSPADNSIVAQSNVEVTFQRTRD